MKDTDWKSKYQNSIKDLDQREADWQEIEGILRKTIGRLSIAGRGHDGLLDRQLREVQELSRKKQDRKLVEALDSLDEVVRKMDESQAGTSPVDSGQTTGEALQGLVERLHLDRECKNKLGKQFAGAGLVTTAELEKLATMINRQLDMPPPEAEIKPVIAKQEADSKSTTTGQEAGSRPTAAKSETRVEPLAHEQKAGAGPAASSLETSADSVMATLISRLSLFAGSEVGTEKIQADIQSFIDSGEWNSAIDEVIGSISTLFQDLKHEKIDLEQFIAGITEQLLQISHVLIAERENLDSNQQDTLSLHDLVQQGMETMRKDVSGSQNVGQLKSLVLQNISLIRDGVGGYFEQINARYDEANQSNQKLVRQLQKMETETQDLQGKLDENKKQLLYDALTGVHNRLAYDEHIVQELARWHRYQALFSYSILDIDHFKKINDEYGHNAGDKALKIVAGMIRKSARKSDLVFRIGGEEFVLILPNTSVDQANTMVDKIRRVIANSNIHFKQKTVQITLSAGITEARQDDNQELIYERADRALYQAKDAGRNCQIIAG